MSDNPPEIDPQRLRQLASMGTTAALELAREELATVREVVQILMARKEPIYLDLRQATMAGDSARCVELRGQLAAIRNQINEMNEGGRDLANEGARQVALLFGDKS